jgi:cobalt-zinc-cadmium efflux system protein
MSAEVVGGLITGSLALLADAGHMLSDAASLGLALFALWIASRPRNSTHTYGYFRTEILAALANGATLVAVSIYIFFEAYHRWLNPPPVRGGLMMAIAVGGLAVNVAGLMILRGGRGESLNIQGAWLHVLADTLGSVQAIIAGAVIWLLGWNWADPLASFLIGGLVIFSSWQLLKESVMVLMESSPGHIDVDEVNRAMVGVEGVRDVHDLHIWTISSGMVALSAHVTCRPDCDRDTLLERLSGMLESRFEISHTTIQVEGDRFEECRPDF